MNIEMKLLTKVQSNLIEAERLYRSVEAQMTAEFLVLEPHIKTQDQKVAVFDMLAKKWNWDSITDLLNSSKFQAQKVLALA